MTFTISPDMQAAFEFAVDRHQGQPIATYETLLAHASTDDDAWGKCYLAQIRVANGIVRWLRSHDEAFIAAFVDDMQAHTLSRHTWAAFRVMVWEAMDAAAWLRRWDCWTPRSDLWCAAMFVAFFILTKTDLPYTD